MYVINGVSRSVFVGCYFDILFDIILSVKMHFTKQFTAQTNGKCNKFGIVVFWGPSGFCRVVCIA